MLNPGTFRIIKLLSKKCPQLSVETFLLKLSQVHLLTEGNPGPVPEQHFHHIFCAGHLSWIVAFLNASITREGHGPVNLRLIAGMWKTHIHNESPGPRGFYLYPHRGNFDSSPRELLKAIRARHQPLADPGPERVREEVPVLVGAGLVHAGGRVPAPAAHPGVCPIHEDVSGFLCVREIINTRLPGLVKEFVAINPAPRVPRGRPVHREPLPEVGREVPVIILQGHDVGALRLEPLGVGEHGALCIPPGPGQDLCPLPEAGHQASRET